jgi:glycosyltransferase involved in cell wall biosynthesis
MTHATALPRFSIVMPSFNTADYLAETLDSILSQDYPDFEFIVTDGGSTDGTLDILERYKDDPRLKWVSEPDGGQCDAINKGFRMATGDLHYWANADDPLEPGALRKVAALLTDFDRPQWAVGAAMLIDGKGKEYWPRVVEEVDASTFLLWGLKWIPTQSVFWNRKMWETAGPFDEHLHYVMDLGLWERMHLAAPCIVTKEVLARYRLHGDSKSLSSIPKSEAERKRHVTQLILQAIAEAQAEGPEALEELASSYAHYFDELTKQAVLTQRLEKNRLTGPVLRL